MTQLVNSDFHGSDRFRPRRPNLLRRVVRRYQLVELFVIMGAILLLWGGSSLGKLQAALNDAPAGWFDSGEASSCPPRRNWCL